MLSCTTSKVICKKTKKIDILGNLPPEMVQNICLYLTPSDVFEVWNCNPRWRYHIMNDYFWKKKCQVDNVLPKEESKKTEVFKKLNDRFDYWHSTYYYDYALKNNWKNDLYEEIPIKGVSHSLKHVILHYFDEETIVTSAIPCDDKLYVINPSTGAVQKTFSFDSAGECAKKLKIRKFNDKLLLFGRHNVFLWNLHTGELVMTKKFEQRTKTDNILIHKNLIGFTTYKPYYGRFYIFNMDTQNVTLIALDVKTFYFYENLGILLRKHGLINKFNIDNVELVSHPCPKKHYISGILLKDHYLIALCENWHMTTWTIDHIDQSLTKLISFSIIDCMQNRSNYRKPSKFLLLHDNQVGYQIRKNSKFYIWNFLTGMYLFKMDIVEPCLEKIIGNQLVLLSYCYNYNCKCIGSQVWCLKTGKLIRTFDLINNVYLTYNKIIHFTETKMLLFNDNHILVIRDFDKKIKTDI